MHISKLSALLKLPVFSKMVSKMYGMVELHNLYEFDFNVAQDLLHVSELSTEKFEGKKQKRDPMKTNIAPNFVLFLSIF